MLAGFETPTSGTIMLDGQDLAGLPPYERPLNMMFQSYALFPHLTVWDNIAFGLRRARMPADEMRQRVEAMLKLVQLTAFAKRKPHQLSGGQQQRVALARSLAKKPQLLLLDEPLGALDKKLREETQIELVNIIEEVGVTCVMVTHDQEEAMTMASRIAVMSEGRLLQVGAPGEIYETPANRFVADFIGNVNLMDGTLVEDEPGHVRHRVRRLPPLHRPRHHRHARACRSRWRCGPRRSASAASRRSHDGVPDADFNRVRGTVSEMSYFGSFTVYHLALPSGAVLKVSQSNTERERGGQLTWGDEAWASWSTLCAGGADVMTKPALRGRLRRGRAAVIAIPYLWLLVFFLLPFLVVMKISVSEMDGATFKDLVRLQDGSLAFNLKFANYLLLVQDDLYFSTYLSSLKYAAVTTVAVPVHRLSVRLLHGARQADRAAGAADAGDAAVLDLVPAARLRLEGPADRERLGRQRDQRARPRPRCSPRSA